MVNAAAQIPCEKTAITIVCAAIRVTWLNDGGMRISMRTPRRSEEILLRKDGQDGEQSALIATVCSGPFFVQANAV